MSNPPSNAYTTYWVVWFFTSISTFLVPELYSLFSGNFQNTLSENIWRLEALVPGQSVVNWTFFHFAFTAGFIVLAVWLTGHFGWGLWAR